MIYELSPNKTKNQTTFNDEKVFRSIIEPKNISDPIWFSIPTPL